MPMPMSLPMPSAAPILAHLVQAQTLPKVQTHAMNSDPVPGPQAHTPASEEQARGRSSPTPTWALGLSTAHRSCPSGPRGGNG